MAATLVGPRTNAVEHFHAVLQPHQQITGIRHSAFQGIARILGTQEEKGGGVGGEGGSGRGRESAQWVHKGIGQQRPPAPHLSLDLVRNGGKQPR